MRNENEKRKLVLNGRNSIRYLLGSRQGLNNVLFLHRRAQSVIRVRDEVAESVIATSRRNASTQLPKSIMQAGSPEAPRCSGLENALQAMAHSPPHYIPNSFLNMSFFFVEFGDDER